MSVILGMAYNFYPVHRERMYLIPPCPGNWLPKNCLVWLVLDAVKQMNLSRFYANYLQDGWGRTAYDPEDRVAVPP